MANLFNHRDQHSRQFEPHSGLLLLLFLWLLTYFLHIAGQWAQIKKAVSLARNAFFYLSVHHLLNLESECTWLVVCTVPVHRECTALCFTLSWYPWWVGNLKQNQGETMGFILGNTASQVIFDGQDWSRPRMSLSLVAGGTSRDLGWKPWRIVQGPLFQCRWLDLTILIQEGLYAKGWARHSATEGCGCREMERKPGTRAQLLASPDSYAHPGISFSLKLLWLLLFPSGECHLHEDMDHSSQESQF